MTGCLLAHFTQRLAVSMLSDGWRRPPLESAAGRASCAPVITCKSVRPSGQTATLDEVKDGRAPRKPGRRLSGAKQVQHATLLCANPPNRRRKRAERRGRSRFSDLRESVRSQAHHFQIARPERKRRCCTKRVASNRGAHRGGPRARAKADKIERPEAARICDPKLKCAPFFRPVAANVI